MRVRSFVRGSLFVLLLLVSALPAVAQGVGAIGGTVADASGGVLPGVGVILSSASGGVGSNQTTVTGDQGAVQFLRLTPGTYTVTAVLQGFRPAEQRNIVVDSDMTARVNLKLEIGSLAEGVTVSGEAPLLDTTTALRQTVLSREALEALPNRTDIWSIAKVLPGVTLSKVDVGGSEGFLQSSDAARHEHREQVHHRRPRRLEPRRQRHDRNDVSRPLCVPGNQLHDVLKQTDLSVRKVFRYQSRSVSPRIDIFNATNDPTITTWVTQLGQNYHIPSAIQRGRVIKLSVSAEF
jgi:hypothetical protein